MYLAAHPLISSTLPISAEQLSPQVVDLLLLSMTSCVLQLKLFPMAMYAK